MWEATLLKFSWSKQEEIATSSKAIVLSFFSTLVAQSSKLVQKVSHTIKAEKDGLGEMINWPSQDILDMWVRISQLQDRDSKGCPKEGISLLHIAAEHGLPRLVELISRSDKKQLATSVEIFYYSYLI